MYHHYGVHISQKDTPQWGLGYKLVTRKIGALRKPCSLKAKQMDRIIRAPFAAHPVWDDDVGAKSAEDCPLFSIKE